MYKGHKIYACKYFLGFGKTFINITLTVLSLRITSCDKNPHEKYFLEILFKRQNGIPKTLSAFPP